MKYVAWGSFALFLGLLAGCNLFNPSANEVTIEASNQYGGSCPFAVNLDGNNPVTIQNGGSYTWPLVSPGSHTLNFSTSGTCGSSVNCTFSNSGSTNSGQNYSATFNTTGGNVYVGTVKQNGSSCGSLVESGP